MVREIKFRAWDKKGNEMIYIKNEEEHKPYIRIQHTKGAVLIIGEEWEMEPVDCIMDIELMQYTGLKDKNGVEIYEGDIIKMDDEEWVEQVEWEEGMASCGCCYSKFQGSGFVNTWQDMRKEGNGIEVIGNIYQNPELLK